MPSNIIPSAAEIRETLNHVHDNFNALAMLASPLRDAAKTLTSQLVSSVTSHIFAPPIAGALGGYLAAQGLIYSSWISRSAGLGLAAGACLITSSEDEQEKPFTQALEGIALGIIYGLGKALIDRSRCPRKICPFNR